MSAKNTIPIKDIIINVRNRKEFGDIDTLADNISQLGLLQPVVINENNELIDGQRRILAFEKLARTEIPFFRIDLEKVVLGEFSANHYRKEWTYSEMVEIKRAIEPYQKQAAKERQLAGKRPSGNLPQGKTRDIVAKFVGVGERRLKKADEIVTAAEQNPEKYQSLVDEMDSKKNVDEPYKKLINEQKREELKKSIRSEIQLPQGCKLFLGDFKERGKEIPDNSIDLIFTDPHYRREDLPKYDDLGYLAQRVLRQGGSLVAYVPQYALVEVGNKIESKGLKYRWEFSIEHTGKLVAYHDSRIVIGGKRLLWFTKGDKISAMAPCVYEGTYIHDFIKSTPPDKTLHELAQSSKEAEYYISKFVPQNVGLVLDPFMGSATTAIAALRQGRLFIGIEVNAERFETAEANIKKNSSSNNNKDNTGYHFMDPQTYETITLQENLLAEAKDYLVENLPVEVLFTEGRPVQVELPSSVQLKVVEAPEGLRGDTASNVTKPAVLETGKTVNVPLFINEGETVKIDTRTGAYMGRA